MRQPLRLAVAVILSVVFVIAVPASAANVRPTGGAMPNEILVKIRSNASANAVSALEQQLDADESKHLAKLKDGSLYRMHSRSKNTEALAAALAHNPNVEYAEPNYVVRLMASPNDPSYTSLWGLNNSGQTISGVPGSGGADIDAEAAWAVTTGSSSIVVGVVDTGVDYTHPDLAANMWSNPGGKGNAACAAGTRGFNAINDTCNPMDDHYHGTHVAGTIGAVGNNGSGVAGVNWNVSIMALKFLDAGGYGSTAGAVSAIDFAVQAKIDGVNVRVLSNSWGGGPFSKALLDVINKANENDILFVAAAGNDTANNDSSPHYPANYATANMISVAATDNRDRLASFSDWGLKTVHLGAPGVAVLSTLPGNSYGYLNGTSMATPHVSGVAALVLAKTPSLTTAQVKSAILDSVDVIPSLTGITTTGGRLNAAKAVGGTASPDFAVTITPSSRTVTRGNSASYTVSITPANGFSGAVALSSTGLPTGISASFTPSSTSTTSTMLVTTTNATAATTHSIPVTATSGAMTRSGFATLNVTTTPALAACPTFTASAYTGSAPVAVAVGDVNRDGRPDVAVAETGTGRVRVLVGGSTGFGTSFFSTMGTAPIAVAIADFDGDGKPDLASANSGSNNVSIARGNGDATFGTAVNFAAGTSPFALAAGDFDRDGHLDLAVANNGGSNISILLGQGNGTFAAPVNHSTASGPYSVATGDVDGDGRLDLAVANFNANTVSVLRGNGDGTFQAAVNFTAGQGPSSAALADLDGDGRVDLAVSNYKTNNVSILLGNGDGTFDPSVQYAAGLAPSSVAAGDLNADGVVDLVTSNTDAGTLSVLMGTGTGTFTTQVPFGYGYSYYQNPQQVVVADLNGDGRSDIAVADSGYYGGFIYVRNLGDCTFNCGTFTAASDQSAGSTPESVATGDFNGDGNPDFAAANSGGNSVTISVGNGNGGFTGGVTVSAGTTPHGIVAGDFDRDGELDLAVGSSGSAQVVILRGNGDATFQTGVSYATATTPRSVATGDFNRDGKLDLAVAARGADVVSVLLGNGDGTFASSVDYGTGDEPEAVTIGDFNRDGRLDLATANAASANVSLLLGNGDGTFQTATSLGAGTTPQAILAADLSADGKPDLAVANGGSSNVSFLRGNGDGTFAAAVGYDAGTNPAGLAAADWNNDGRPDLATANTTSNDVSVLLGSDGGTFVPPAVTPVGSGPAAIATADFNGDGKPDFVTANSGAATTSVLLDSCPVPDLTVTKTHSGAFTAGQSGATYTITVTNSGAGLASGSVTVTDTLPSGLTATAISGTGWTCTLTPLVCARADALLGGGVYPPITLTVKVSGGAPSSLTNTVTISGGGEFNTANNGASDVTAITQVTDLSIVKTHTGNFARGATGRAYSLLVRNAGGQATSGTVTVTDALPSGLTATSMSGSGWSCNVGSLTCTRSDVLAGKTNYPPITLLVNVANDAPLSIVNTASVSGGGDSESSNNTSSDPTAIWVPNPCASFGRTEYSAGGYYARGMAVADYNGDGRADLAVSNYYDHKVSILLGQADGTFGAPVKYATNNYPRRMVAIDLDVDGDPDLAIITDAGISVLINNGAAVGFSAPVLYSISGGYLGDITRGDFNGDGSADLAVTSAYNGVRVLFGDGNGALGTPVSYAVSEPYGVATADVNSDGLLDLVVANYYGVSVMLGQGGGTFGTATKFLNESISSVAIGDLTGDGILDIAAGTSYYGIYVLTGAGDGTFTKTNTISMSSYSAGSYVSVADLNADGNLDVVGVGSYALVTAFGNGNGTFQTITSYPMNTYSSTPVAVGDFNSDGKADMAVTNDYSGVTVMLAGCADLSITKTHTGDFRAGQTNAIYTLTVKNEGTAYTSGTVTLTDILPDGLTATSLYGYYYYDWNCTLSSLTCTRTAPIAPNESAAISLYVNVSFGAPASVTNTATISGGGDINSANNTASDPTNIVHAPDLTVTKTHSGVFVVGGTGVYTIAVGNIGTGPTSGTVTVQDALPFGMTPASMSGAGWSCNLTNRTCTRSDVLGGTQSYPPITLTVSIADGISAQVNNFASVSGGGDTLTNNNSTLDATSILVAPLNVVASAVSTTQVGVTWATVPNATQYEVLRATGNGPYTVLGTTVSGFYLDNGRSQNTVYLYKVRAYNASTAGPLSVPDLVTMFTFTDDPMPTRATMKASYIEQLRTAINLVREAANLGPLTPDGSAAAGWSGRASHITQLQSGINAARTALGVPTIYYFGSPFVGGPIQAGDITNLRAAVK